MARTLKRKSRNSTDGTKAVESSGTAVAAKGASTTVSVPQIQELQDLMDSQKVRVEAIKSTYVQQNTQLAKANSSLMMRLSDLEKKISELVQENVILRSKATLSECGYKDKLNEQIEILENGIAHRVEEIFHMFDRVRNKEKLPAAPNSKKSSEMRSILRNRRGDRPPDGNRKSVTVQFSDSGDNIAAGTPEDDHTPEGTPQSAESLSSAQDEENSQRKRRKSSRRESIFLPEDFDFSYEKADTAATLNTTPGPDDEPIYKGLGEENARTHSPLEEDCVDTHQDHSEDASHAEASFNFTNSIIEYSIPEEFVPSNSAETEQQSSSKIDVFRDEPDASLKLQDGEDKNLLANDPTFVPLPSQNKVKHSMRPLNDKSRSKMIDEVMPTTTSGSGSCDMNFTRPRRTRGKAIDYTLPSLRAKMRRPSEKLVDATTFTSIHELQVTKARGGKIQSRKSNTKPTLQEAAPQVLKALDVHQAMNPNESEMPRTTDQATKAKNVNYEAASVIETDSVTKCEGKQPILKDITNKPKVRKAKTRKLLKNAIINDICDTTSGQKPEKYEQSGSSFRLSEDDLSVFDLIGSSKVKQSNKTYRAKTKKMVTK